MADPSSSGENPLHFRLIEPTIALQGAVVVSHGYAEHSGRYGHVARAMADSGFGVLLYDHRGFGRSPGRPAFIARISRLVEDLGHMLTAARSAWTDVPVVLFGHSMGGLIATLYALRNPGAVDGLILSSPLLKSSEAAILQRFATVIGEVAPRLPTIKMDRSAISRETDVVEQANADPLNYHGRIPARTGAEFIRGMREVEREGHRLDMPLLVFHGTADRLTDPDGSAELYARASTDHKQLSLFEGAYHETFNDLDRDRVIEGVVTWMTDLAEDVGTESVA
ncbi:MAG: lysophospholipase [Rhodothermales bacterium]|nr:lysophospholipase [Rhodothermales bacterium]MBO6780161.1 lysophospholipase [Rhodothermales bacterium]